LETIPVVQEKINVVGITVPQPQDIPFSVQGYITDPKQVGYQILTNYESTYRAPSVGNDAWRLYEVLRSFCHQGCNTCYPSINLLMAILGLKDRSVLIGRAKPKKVKGKMYSYPGLIQILQGYNLVIAEVLGDGPTLRYTFHVNLTPGLLTDEQLGELPQLLQDKHRELLERCEAERKALEAKKKPPKLPVNKDVPEAPKETDRGIGNSNRGIGNSNTSSWNFQYKQHPLNTTHRTTPATREDHNNNSSDSPAPSDVVVALISQGISEKVAKRLAGHYSKERIEEKITYLTFLNHEQPDKVQNPRGWLRRAIEEDYGPPDGFVTAEARVRLEAEAAEQAQRAEAIEQQHQAFAAEQQAQQAAFRRQLRERYGTTDADLHLWAEVLACLKDSINGLHELLARDAHILACTAQGVTLGFANEGALRQLDHPGTMAALKRQLKLMAKRPLAVERVLLAVAEMGDAGENGAGSSAV
jgi:hypothetical protein